MIISESGWDHFQTRFAEWQNGLMLLLWGGFMLLHPTAMTDPRAISHWQGMLNMFPQSVWALVAFVTGSARIAALYVNGKHRRTPTIRLVASFISAFIICQMLIGLAKAESISVGLVAVYPLFLLGDLYSAYRASADVTFVAKRYKAELGRERNT